MIAHERRAEPRASGRVMHSLAGARVEAIEGGWARVVADSPHSPFFLRPGRLAVGDVGRMEYRVAPYSGDWHFVKEAP
jgi:hypothetical protein